MGNSCRKAAIDVIPDKQVMLNVVDSIVALEELLKSGTELTPEQQKQVAKTQRVVRDMTKLKKVTDAAVKVP